MNDLSFVNVKHEKERDEFFAGLTHKLRARPMWRRLSDHELDQVEETLTEARLLRLEEREEREKAFELKRDKLEAIQKIMAESNLSMEDLKMLEVDESNKIKGKTYKSTGIVHKLSHGCTYNGRFYMWSGTARAPRPFKILMDQGATKESFLLPEDQWCDPEDWKPHWSDKKTKRFEIDEGYMAKERMR